MNSAPTVGLGRRGQIRVLLVCAVSLFMTYVDTSALNVALPTVQRELGAKLSELQWVLDSYQLVLASFLVLAGSLADRFGRRRVFRAGLLIFSLGSLSCSLATGVVSLVGFRVLQALGGCMLTPVSLSIVRQVFTDPAQRARAIGWWSAIFGLGVAAGPLLGGPLVAAAGWRSVFWVNVPIGLCAWLLAGRYVPESRAPVSRRVDPAGQALASVALAALTFALIEAPSWGWAAPAILGTLALSAMAGAGLFAVERRVSEPLLEPRFFANPNFRAATGLAVLSYLIFSGFLFVNTLYLQQVRGDSALVAGLAIAPVTLMIVLTAPVSGRIMARFGARPALAIAGGCLTAGSATLPFTLTPHSPYPLLALSYLLLGAGFGLINPPISNAAVSGMPPAQASVAAAVASTSRQVGNTLGVAVLGSMLTYTHGQAGSGAAPWVLATACAVGCILLAFTCTRADGPIS